MKFTLVLLIVAAIFGVVLSCSDEKWESYKTEFNKSYSGAEDIRRKGIFCKTVESIEKHNAEFDKGLTTYTQGINQFTDLEPEEIAHNHGVGK